MNASSSGDQSHSRPSDSAQAARGQPVVQFLSPGAISNDSASLFDEYATNPRFQELQSELQTLLFTEAQSGTNTGGNSPTQTGQSTDNVGQPEVQAQPRVDPDKMVKYLNIWITECAPWLDMFDQERHFGLQVTAMSQSSPAVLYALLALSARQLERQANLGASSRDSLELYSEAISSLTYSLQAKRPDALVTACLLCVLEMMSVRPRDWRRHSQGCAALFEANGVNGFSGGLVQAVFWCYARMDLCAAIIADGTEGTALPIDKWVLVDQSFDGQNAWVDLQHAIGKAFIDQGRRTPDMHANYAVYICAKVCNLIARRTEFLELGVDNDCTDDVYAYTWMDLWTELQTWFEKRPREMLPVKMVQGSATSMHFPRLLFAHWAAISGNQVYHTACILLLESQPTAYHRALIEPQSSPLWHARHIVGISMVNHHRGCLNNAIQPLYIAGKFFSHREEQKIVCDLLHRIEDRSGWGSRWRIKDLESAWGYPRGRFG